MSVSVAPSSRPWRRPQRPGPQLPLASHWPTLPHTLRPIAALSLHVLRGNSAVSRRASTPWLALAASARACGGLAHDPAAVVVGEPGQGRLAELHLTEVPTS